MERSGNQNHSSKHAARNSGGFRDKINKFVKKHASLTLRKKDFKVLLEMYLDWRQSTYNGYKYSSLRQQAFSRKTLLYIMERLFWSKVNDSRYVVIILLFLYETEHHLLSIFSPPRDKCNSVANVDRHLWTQYFLHHAYTKKMMVHGERLVNLVVEGCYPIEIATSLPNPEMLRHILRYGTIAGESSMDDWEDRMWQAKDAFFDAVEEIFHMNPRLLDSKELNLDPENMSKYNDLLCCCNLILSEMTPRLCTLFRIRLLQFSTNRAYSSFTDVLITATLPWLMKCLAEPLSLKHASRLSIRKILNLNWLLPQGIYKLSLPASLKQYLDVI